MLMNFLLNHPYIYKKLQKNHPEGIPLEKGKLIHKIRSSYSLFSNIPLQAYVLQNATRPLPLKYDKASLLSFCVKSLFLI